MSDLARLTSILAQDRSLAAILATVVYHSGAFGVSPGPVDGQRLREVVEWLASSPGVGVGSYVSEDELSFLRTHLEELRTDPGLCDAVAYLVRACRPPPGRYTKEHRNMLILQLASQQQIGTHVAVMSPLEVAALDRVVASSYATAAGAVAAYARMVNAGVITRVRRFTRQLDCARHMIACDVKGAHDELRTVMTPWCVSMQSAAVYVAVIAASTHRALVTDMVSRRAATVASRLARVDIERVRAIVRPAVGLLESCIFDPIRLEFRATGGEVMARINERSPEVTIAFAFALSRGNADVLLEMAQRRVTLMNDESRLSRHCLEYYDLSVEAVDMLCLFARSLEADRRERVENGRGGDVNKGPGLGYVARGGTRMVRNTHSCINRIQEMVALARHRGVDVSKALVIVDWAGAFDSNEVLAAGALMKLDICVDVGASLSLEDPFETDRVDPPIRHYSCVLRRLATRSLPTLAHVEYDREDGVIARVGSLLSHLGSHSTSYIYIHGGTPADRGVTQAESVEEAVARAELADYPLHSIKCALLTTDFILPKACYHWMDSSVDELKATTYNADDGCVDCRTAYWAMYKMAAMTTKNDFRLVKPRSAYGHNGQFDLEYARGRGDGRADTGAAVDSAAFLSNMRNWEWDGPVIQPHGVTGAHEQFSAIVDRAFYDLCRPIREYVYQLLAGGTGTIPPVPEDELESLVASVF